MILKCGSHYETNILKIFHQPPLLCSITVGMTSLTSVATDKVIVTVKLKWGKTSWNDFVIADESVAQLKQRIYMLTKVTPERQKLMCKGSWKGVLPEDANLSKMTFKANKSQIVLVGSAEVALATVTGNVAEDVNIVNDMNMNDLEIDFEDGQLLEKLYDSISSTPIVTRMMNEPRTGFPLLVLDLDHTLLCFDTKSGSNFEKMKRPYMHEFLCSVYQYYDIVIWSQTSWRWLEIKLTELGFLKPSNPYKILFVLDKECMFRRKAPSGKKKRGKAFKPLELIWSKFPCWTRANTLHVDDVKANFGLNPQNGIHCKCWRAEDTEDMELLQLANYLQIIAKKEEDMSSFDHSQWLLLLSETMKEKTL